jgi:hypothetical protein
MLFEEVDPDRFLVALREDAAAVALDEARFAHCPISHNDNLKRKTSNALLSKFIENRQKLLLF